jgi:hypothetical protein
MRSACPRRPSEADVAIVLCMVVDRGERRARLALVPARVRGGRRTRERLSRRANLFTPLIASDKAATKGNQYVQ